MTRLTPLKAVQIIRIIRKLGFQSVRQEGSHIYFRHLDGRATVIPLHKGEDIGKGLIKKILQDIEMTWEDFLHHK